MGTRVGWVRDEAYGWEQGIVIVMQFRENGMGMSLS